jgi:hypothetical protein
LHNRDKRDFRPIFARFSNAREQGPRCGSPNLKAALDLVLGALSRGVSTFRLTATRGVISGQKPPKNQQKRGAAEFRDFQTPKTGSPFQLSPKKALG